MENIPAIQSKDVNFSVPLNDNTSAYFWNREYGDIQLRSKPSFILH